MLAQPCVSPPNIFRQRVTYDCASILDKNNFLYGASLHHCSFSRMIFTLVSRIFVKLVHKCSCAHAQTYALHLAITCGLVAGQCTCSLICCSCITYMYVDFMKSTYAWENGAIWCVTHSKETYVYMYHLSYRSVA